MTAFHLFFFRLDFFFTDWAFNRSGLFRIRGFPPGFNPTAVIQAIQDTLNALVSELNSARRRRLDDNADHQQHLNVYTRRRLLDSFAGGNEHENEHDVPPTRYLHSHGSASASSNSTKSASKSAKSTSGVSNSTYSVSGGTFKSAKSASGASDLSNSTRSGGSSKSKSKSSKRKCSTKSSSSTIGQSCNATDVFADPPTDPPAYDANDLTDSFTNENGELEVSPEVTETLAYLSNTDTSDEFAKSITSGTTSPAIIETSPMSRQLLVTLFKPLTEGLLFPLL